MHGIFRHYTLPSSETHSIAKVCRQQYNNGCLFQFQGDGTWTGIGRYDVHYLAMFRVYIRYVKGTLDGKREDR